MMPPVWFQCVVSLQLLGFRRCLSVGDPNAYPAVEERLKDETYADGSDPEGGITVHLHFLVRLPSPPYQSGLHDQGLQLSGLCRVWSEVRIFAGNYVNWTHRSSPLTTALLCQGQRSENSMTGTENSAAQVRHRRDVFPEIDSGCER